MLFKILRAITVVSLDFIFIIYLDQTIRQYIGPPQSFKNTVQTLLNELFLLDQDNNENILEDYIKENIVKFD